MLHNINLMDRWIEKLCHSFSYFILLSRERLLDIVQASRYNSCLQGVDTIIIILTRKDSAV